MKGLICEVFVAKNFGDCSNHGLSSRVSSVVLTGPGIPAIFEATPDRPEVKLDKRGRENDLAWWRVVPADLPEGVWSMFGGAFVWTSDARFPAPLPLKLHDRIEGAT